MAIPRGDSYEGTLNTIKLLIPQIKAVHSSLLVLQSKAIPGCDGIEAIIAPQLWADIASDIGPVDIVKEQQANLGYKGIAYYGSSYEKGNFFEVYVKTLIGSSARITVCPEMSTEAFYILVANALYQDTSIISHLRLLLAGRYLAGPDMTRTVKDEKLTRGCIVSVAQRLCGGKPVIYVIPASGAPLVDASVVLQLSDSWSLSALWPIPSKSVRGAHSYGQLVSWDILAASDGTLVHKESGIKASYLYWEALTNHSTLVSPPPSPSLDDGSVGDYGLLAFDPARPAMNSKDSVMLPCDKIGVYLDRALTVLGLHVEARTSFITYWLPSVLKHSHVALRFLPQRDYEQAAKLSVKPAPDVVTRVFMLFRGVKDAEVGDWSDAAARAGDSVDFWRDVVGVDLDAALDESLFRVLEWGGMELVG